MYRAYIFDVLTLALIDLLGALNSPRQDEVLLKEAGVSLDRALFPLLVRIAATGALKVGELADQVGRDQSTVSRQMSKLEALGLVRRGTGKVDRRAREAVITEQGKQMVLAITEARRRLMSKVMEGWSDQEVLELAKLNRRLVDGFRAGLNG